MCAGFDKLLQARNKHTDVSGQAVKFIRSDYFTKASVT